MNESLAPPIATAAPTAREWLARLGRGELTPAASWHLANATIRTGDRFGAFVHVPSHPPGGVEAAGAPTADQPLAGLPIAVKDIFDTADMPTAYGSAAYTGHRPIRDAAIVAELRALGAVIVGKTASTEFAAWSPTAAVNPHDPRRTPGGSSAGSAVAVAAGLVPLALGTQTLGSVIRPASYCGVVGFKPTYARLSRVGVKALADSLDTIGFFARTVADVALLHRALLPGSFAERVPTGRLAFLRGPHWDDADPDARLAMEAAVVRLRQAGLAIDDIEWPDLAEATSLGRQIHDYELGRGLVADYFGWGDAINPSMRDGIARARTMGPDDHGRALMALEALRGRLASRFAPYDAVLCLAATGQAPRGLESTGNSILNVGWTALHVPCLTLPVLQGLDGLPIGLQIVTDRYEEQGLLATAARIEAILAG